MSAPNGRPPTAKSHAPPQWREAVAGAGAGALSRTVMAPLERLKLLKQLQHADPQLHNQSVWRIFGQVWKEQGWYSFWRGNWPAVLRVAGTASINFTCLEYYKRTVVGPLLLTLNNNSSNNRTQKFWTSLMAGGMAGATSTTALYPFEFARTRLAMDMGRDSSMALASTQTTTTPRPRQYQGMIDVVVQITRSDGIWGLYRGYGIALVGGIFYRILYLGGYDALKYELKLQNKDNSSLSWSQRVAAAQTISLTAGTLSYPLDSIRRRMMMQSGNCRPAHERRYQNSLDCLVQVWRQEGVRGFYLGIGPNLLRSVGGALLLVAYDALRVLL